MPKPEEYLEVITNIVYKYGVRGLTMEQIAAKIGVTKGTLYNNFGTKEELIKAIIDFKFGSVRNAILEYASHPTENAILIHSSVMRFATQIRSETSFIFMQTLHDNYPELFDYMAQKSLRLMNEFFALNIPRGRSEGLYRTDFDIDIIAAFANGAVNNFIDSYLNNQTTPSEKTKMQIQVTTLLIRGMVTEEGAKILDEELLKVN